MQSIRDIITRGNMVDYKALIFFRKFSVWGYTSLLDMFETLILKVRDGTNWLTSMFKYIS